jgi:hypothetical protein
MSLHVQRLGLETVARDLATLPQRVQAAQRLHVGNVQQQYLSRLVAATPRGRGPTKGQLAAAYQTTLTTQDLTTTATITNTTAYLVYVLNGRKAVQAKAGKALRFIIDGEVLFRKRVKAAKANPFDDRVADQMQPVLDALPNTIARAVLP